MVNMNKPNKHLSHHTIQAQKKTGIPCPEFRDLPFSSGRSCAGIDYSDRSLFSSLIRRIILFQNLKIC